MFSVRAHRFALAFVLDINFELKTANRNAMKEGEQFDLDCKGAWWAPSYLANLHSTGEADATTTIYVRTALRALYVASPTLVWTRPLSWLSTPNEKSQTIRFGRRVEQIAPNQQCDNASMQ